ncbi:MAG TPA: SDR family oxidoreductase [Candidatus Angelobacter sp.]|nr:SDR family oxidoreductase [Candidatus Angelobacter sp.]
MNDLKGKTVLVTGGARRLGRAMVLALGRAGVQVAFTYLNSLAEADETGNELGRLQAKYRAIKCDVRSESSVARAVETTLDTFGRIDVLINNAGVFETAPLEKITQEQWENVFATNVGGPFLTTKHCTPALRESKGHIVNLGSLGGEKPWVTHPHYCASKAALHMFTRVSAKALAPDVAVNCVAPGMIDSGEGEHEQSLLKRLAERAPASRNGTPEDVVSAVMYFAACPHYITGQILTVDGGLGLV